MSSYPREPSYLTESMGNQLCHLLVLGRAHGLWLPPEGLRLAARIYATLLQTALLLCVCAPIALEHMSLALVPGEAMAKYRKNPSGRI